MVPVKQNGALYHGVHKKGNFSGQYAIELSALKVATMFTHQPIL